AMVDVSDGFAADLWHLADASGVSFELDEVPVAPGATTAEALGGGEDYQLVFAAPEPDEAVLDAFGALPKPAKVGFCTSRHGTGRLGGKQLPATGWEHRR
ncbi:thiamine-phosphate kinase, partial [Acidimicrobiaceae bacterium USS-CC1]|nr:thiamine-phosphate kinase [Acidiferrimicrobium australe]